MDWFPYKELAQTIMEVEKFKICSQQAETQESQWCKVQSWSKSKAEEMDVPVQRQLSR